MGNTLDIHIHLDKFYPPDPTGPTDYVALGLIGAYASVAFAGNVSLARIATHWKPVCSVNIPLVYAMAFFSLCHMVCVYLDMNFVNEVTETVQGLSCVATTFWGEYLLGLGGFLGVLGVRAFSLMMVAYDVLRPSGPKYRRVLLKSIFFVVFLIPMYSLCLLISVDEDSTYNAALHGCDTAVAYKITLVAVLGAYIAVLLFQGAVLGSSEFVAERAHVIVRIIRVSVPLLLVACIIHFGYMLPHFWGRLAFMCVVFAVHTYAYCALVGPVLWDYRAHRNMPITKFDFELDAFDDEPVSGVISSEVPLYRGDRCTLRVTEDIRWLLETMDARQLTMTPIILLRVEELRGKFFNYAKVAFAEWLFAYNGDVLEQVDPFYEKTQHHIPAYRLITFYNDVQKIYNITQKVFYTDKYLNASSISSVIQPMIDELFRTYLTAHTTTPMNMPARYVTRIRKGFSRATVDEWDVPVLTEILTHILETLIKADDGDYRTQFLVDVEEVLEKYGQTLYVLDEENYDTHKSALSHIVVLLKTLRAGRDTGDENDSVDCPPNEDIYDVSGVHESADDFGDMLQEAPSSAPRDEQLADGAIIYTSPSRALFYFFYDACTGSVSVLRGCCARSTQNVSTMPDDDSVLVHRVSDT